MVTITPIKKGYKQSKIGNIPEGWKVRPIGDFFEFKNGLNKAKEFFGYGNPIINYMDVYKNRKLYQNDITGKVDVTSQEIKSFNVKKGDVFFTRTSETVEEIGVSSVLLNDVINGVFSGFILRARPKNLDLEDVYKEYCFSTDSVRRQIKDKCTYTTRALTNGRVLSNVVILCPPKLEQVAISLSLSDTSALIKHLDKLINKKKAIKQGAMKQLLTGKKRLPGFTDEWEEKKVVDFAECLTGGTPSTKVSEYWGGNIKWMNSGELNNKKIFDVVGRITEKGFEESSTRKIPIDSVLIGLAGQGKTRGTVAINKISLCINQSIAVILPSNYHDSNYLYYNFDYRYEELRSMSTGGEGRASLNLSIIKKIAVKLPPKKEQIAIAGFLVDMDIEIEKLEQKRDKYIMIKNGMMQQLLTGKIRLHVNN